MSFGKFCRSITSPALRAVAEHWHASRGNRTMPSWQDLRPKAIAPHLPIVWAYRFDAQKGEFVGRLAGDQISRAYGKGFHGLTLAEIHTSPDRYQAAKNMLERVISEPAVYLGHGRIYQFEGEFRTGERIVLPLSSDGVSSDGVFGATETGSLPMLHQPVQGVHDTGEWFSLRQPALA
jgi:hypothetical protein